MIRFLMGILTAAEGKNWRRDDSKFVQVKWQSQLSGGSLTDSMKLDDAGFSQNVEPRNFRFSDKLTSVNDAVLAKAEENLKNLT